MFDDQKIFSMKNSSIYHFWDAWRISSISFCFQAKNEDFLSVHWCINTDAKLKWYKNRKAKFIQFSECFTEHWWCWEEVDGWYLPIWSDRLWGSVGLWSMDCWYWWWWWRWSWSLESVLWRESGDDMWYTEETWSPDTWPWPCSEQWPALSAWVRRFQVAPATTRKSCCELQNYFNKIFDLTFMFTVVNSPSVNGALRTDQTPGQGEHQASSQHPEHASQQQSQSVQLLCAVNYSLQYPLIKALIH